MPEIMLALSLGSLIMLSAAQWFPILRGQSQNSAYSFRLEQLLSQAVFAIEKDIRRAGFCAGACQGAALTLGRYPGEADNSCLNVSYDLNRNGVWDEGEEQDAESFGYRLRAGALEIQRGAHDCRGDRWEKLFDPQEVSLAAFQVRPVGGRRGARLYEVRLAGFWAKRPAIQRSVTRLILGRNE